MENKKVKDFIEGEHINVNLLVAACQRGITNTGSPYLNLTLQDSTASIDTKLWDVKPEIEKEMSVGKVFNFDLEINKYKGNLQAKVIKVLPVAQSEINIDEFIFRSPMSKDELRNVVNDGLNSINNETIARIVSAMLNYYDNEFYEYPAASKIHHNFIGGLATHTSGMIKVAMALADIYPSINRDYLVAGVILHDLGKIEELTSPIVTEYTTEGKLLGHISIMDARMLQIGKELKVEDSEELMILRHLILSHHGQYEFGSPVRPETMEAEILTLIDNIDSRVNIIEKAIVETKEGEFTQKIFALDNRAFYNYHK